MAGGAATRGLATASSRLAGRAGAAVPLAALAVGAGAALTLVADVSLVAVPALALGVATAAAAIALRVAARRLPHTGEGWEACPACGARAATGASLARALGGERDQVAAVAVLGLVRFSCPEGLRAAAQCELLAAVEPLAAREGVRGGRPYALAGDRVAVLSSRPAADLRRAVEGLAERLNRSLAGASVAAGVAACGPAGPGAAFERAEQARWRSAAARPAVAAREAAAVRALVSDPSSIAVAYQPVVELASGRVLGYEALMRPRGGRLDSPAVAFEVAGGVGLAAALDRACRDAVLSDAPGLDMRRGDLLFVNVAPGAFVDPELRPGDLVEAVQGAGLAPGQVVLEVREGAAAAPAELAAQAARLRSSGFGIALDDVGGGASRLETLMRCPLDFLKIDELLTQHASRDPAARALFRSLCALAGQLGATLVVEGVEDERLLRFVRAVDGQDAEPLAVHAAQGYQLGRPGPRPQPHGGADGDAGDGVGGDAGAGTGARAGGTGERAAPTGPG